MSATLLTDIFGDEPTNYYGSSFLNRLSFLRENYTFLHQAVIHPSTKFLLLDGLSPPIVPIENVVESSGANHPPFKSRSPAHKLVYTNYANIKDFVGEPFKEPEAEQVANWVSTRDAVGIGRPLIVFLGIQEVPISEKTREDGVEYFTFDQKNSGIYHGTPYFVVDISENYLKSDRLKEQASVIKAANDELKNGFSIRFNPFGFRLSGEESGFLAQARQYVDWNSRNRFCGGCGLPNFSVNGGTKLVCPSKDNGKDLPPCATRGVISNLQFPRTDVSIIAAVINYSNDKILLGRGKRFPPGFYSTLAGFLEPAETIEECVRREIWEEAGVKVGRVVMYSSQPWPYPANIMIGCVAQVTDPSEEAHKIHLGHDPELADAQWYSYDELREYLKVAGSGSFAKRPDGLPEGAPQLPPPEAVAWILIDAVVNSRIKGLAIGGTKI